MLEVEELRAQNVAGLRSLHGHRPGDSMKPRPVQLSHRRLGCVRRDLPVIRFPALEETMSPDLTVNAGLMSLSNPNHGGHWTDSASCARQTAYLGWAFLILLLTSG
jgi:hypothetical protein